MFLSRVSGFYPLNAGAATPPNDSLYFIPDSNAHTRVRRRALLIQLTYPSSPNVFIGDPALDFPMINKVKSINLKNGYPHARVRLKSRTRALCARYKLVAGFIGSVSCLCFQPSITNFTVTDFFAIYFDYWCNFFA